MRTYIEIKEVYEMSGLEKKEFSKKLNTSYDYVVKMLEGKANDLPIHILENFINKFNCEIKDIIKIEDTKRRD